MYRSHNCGQLRKENNGEKVTLSGWVHRRRDHGDLIFVDLRDRYGLTQVVFDPSDFKEAHIAAEDLRSEFVIKVEGEVRVRPEGQRNENMDTGEVELLVSEVEILNRSKTPPFEIDHPQDANEEIRLKYRYLDLRRDRMKKNMVFRHKFVKMIRDIFDELDFVEIETPMLMKGTPEGSREFIVPARLYPGEFYVLPQSPQQLKQLLMVAGMDKYFQIARCFRDEDSRGDRQPEFTQLDMEMSFVEEEDVISINEEALKKLFAKLVPEKELMFETFPRLTWKEAMSKYGSDKPDLRFEMQIKDVSDLVSSCDFQVFKQAVTDGGVVKCLKVEGGAEFSRKDIDQYTELAKVYGAKGLAYIKMTDEGPAAPILKFFTEDQLAALIERAEAKTGDIIFFGADSFEVVCNALGNVRLACADRFELRDPNKLACCWVVDFPLFEFSEEEGRLVSAHHPFTAPKDSDLELLETDPKNVLAKAYDVAMNGSEIGGGSIRIHSPETQRKVFKALGISDEDVEIRFGHMLDAFQYGAPPHGGIAWGLDRIIMLLQDEPNIREVIAFPKDSKAKDLLTGAPSALPEATLTEMNVKNIL
ncbi:aspartate--tRNA ligase [Candidatus Peregrinibacteria bacterium]|jgi:aspartyl-tRNA synthetase|nr:aspartate--tRNA ligase [Candidatus Peregrinibacteria bacterium]MBT4631932.1 aspartate--tRNA ligase [Candidatus Peregrinibacteria bacterium]MBT5516456.1 aspartate--tRNA ligase [Candidatus Peregrinibacteria bacterium]MBT5823681.1 aspartate--tRNA ligase [Candidatus Peregrinibacteria bacterium]